MELADTRMSTHDNSSDDLFSFSERMCSFNNQLEILKQKYLDTNIYFTNGHQFTVDQDLIMNCQVLLSLGRSEDTILLDDCNEPVAIKNLQSFMDDVLDLYHKNLNQYHKEYKELVCSRGEAIGQQ